MQQLAVYFSDDAEQEVASLVDDLALIPIAKMIQQGEQLSDDMKESLGKLFSTITDMFSTNVPLVSDPDTTLRTASRDIHLASILRERGIFRLFRLTRMIDQDGAPVYMSIINPVTGTPFAKQEEFIGWFCSEAKVARSLVFMRLATIDRLLSIGMTEDQAFTTIVSHPYAIQETMRMGDIATWGKGGMLLDVNPEAIGLIAQRVAPETMEEIGPLIQAAKDEPDNLDVKTDLIEAAKPALVKLITEVADHDRAKDALDFVKHDILLKPEIRYTWDTDASILLVELMTVNLDSETGERYIAPSIVVPFVPDVAQVPQEIVQDLVRRLPVRSKEGLLIQQ